ncbi:MULTISPECIES: hypothetical protein [Pseudomonas]|uniref:hypothetical protein n=1 Tax=Pseudomonas TaxID=286 RepID=UPI0023D98991|nr:MULTISPECIES: hypothetical protein [Pseudomonas]WEJ24061.1 hypothetical protein N0B28_12525 [Pseudomonas sp. SD17-1]
MELNREQANQLVEQVQRSHRLLAGFYKRILPAIDEVAAKFGAIFWSWDPIDLGRPPRAATKPSRNWAWDYLPLMNAQFLYIRTEGVQHAFFEFHLNTEPAVLRRHRVGNTQPDPLELEETTPSIRIYVYWLVGEPRTDIDQEWRNADYPGGDAFSVSSLTDVLLGTWWEVDLAEFIAAPQKTIEQLNGFVCYPQS